MALPIFDQILAGLEYSFSSFLPVYFFLAIVGMVLLVNAGWTMPLAMILFSGSFIVIGWAGYATYGTLGIAILLIAYVLTITLIALIRR
jgi:hypothetical protein